MSARESTFHESWYRVANLRVTLRPHLKCHRQRMRGQKWHVLEDPINNGFFRLRPEAWSFVSRFDGRHTIEEIWKLCLAEAPNTAPGQSEVIQLLSQLYGSNLIISDLPADATALFSRYEKRRSRELMSWLSSFMFARFPLWDPDDFLQRGLPFVRMLYSRWGLFFWLAVVGVGFKTVIDHFDLLWNQSSGVLAPSNLPLLYVGIVVLALLHELGHAFTCRRYGGEVHTMGIMLLVFTPLPYVDVTSSWSFREKRKRMLVGGGGMIVEIFVASLAAMVWARTAPGTINSLAFNIMFTASVSTILFNINPLLRFDGYYLLSDALDIPNLYSRAQNQIKYLFERYAFGIENVEPQAETRKENTWLIVYGIASQIYRVFLFTSIFLFVSSQFMVLGVIFGFFLIVSWLFVPIGKFINFLATSPRLNRTRYRAVMATLVMVLVPVCFLYLVPMPYYFKAPGIVRSHGFRPVTPESSGYLVKVLVPSGTFVLKGTPLMQLENKELTLQIKASYAQLQQVRAQKRASMESGGAELQALDEAIYSIKERIEFFETQQATLLVCAPTAGTWIGPGMNNSLGIWVSRGESVGAIVDEGDLLFSAVVDQDFSSVLFKEELTTAEIRFFGQSEIDLPVEREPDGFLIVPSERRQLPSAALGYAGGGDIAVSQEGGDGKTASEGFFEVRTDLPEDLKGLVLKHGQRGLIRFKLPNKPYLQQWILSARRLLQKVYGPESFNPRLTGG